MQRDTVSIIIPVYNGEKYVERCLESIINQSYKNIDIILINDNSDDKSMDIINEYIECHKRIKRIDNKSNLGAAESRNIGLLQANSKYVMFLDCDDWLDLNCIERAINKFNSNKEIDIVLWEVKTAYENMRFSSRYKYLYNNIITNKMALNLLSHTFDHEYFLTPLLGCKMFKKELIDHNRIHFPDTIYEDDMFTFLTFLHARKIALITDCHLHYYQHQESITHHFSEKNITDFFLTFKQLYLHIDAKNKEHYYNYLKKSMDSMINNMITNVSSHKMQTNYKTKILTSFYENVNVQEYYRYASLLTI